MPPRLRELMRHEWIETTMKFYVGVNAEMTAEPLWKAVSGDTLGDTAPNNTTISRRKMKKAVEINSTAFSGELSNNTVLPTAEIEPVKWR